MAAGQWTRFNGGKRIAIPQVKGDSESLHTQSTAREATEVSNAACRAGGLSERRP